MRPPTLNPELARPRCAQLLAAPPPAARPTRHTRNSSHAPTTARRSSRDFIGAQLEPRASSHDVQFFLAPAAGVVVSLRCPKFSRLWRALVALPCPSGAVDIGAAILQLAKRNHKIIGACGGLLTATSNSWRLRRTSSVWVPSGVVLLSEFSGLSMRRRRCFTNPIRRTSGAQHPGCPPHSSPLCV